MGERRPIRRLAVVAGLVAGGLAVTHTVSAHDTNKSEGAVIAHYHGRPVVGSVSPLLDRFTNAGYLDLTLRESGPATFFVTGQNANSQLLKGTAECTSPQTLDFKVTAGFIPDGLTDLRLPASHRFEEDGRFAQIACQGGQLTVANIVKLQKF